MMTIVPNTIVKPITCIDSINGNKYNEVRIAVARPEPSSDAVKLAKSIALQRALNAVDQDPHT